MLRRCRLGSAFVLDEFSTSSVLMQGEDLAGSILCVHELKLK